MAQLADLFSVPEMSLLCNITEYFVNKNIDYHPDILFRDVQVSFKVPFDLLVNFVSYLNFCLTSQSSVRSIHPLMHQIVMNKPQDYLDQNPQLQIFFDGLIKANKKLFLVTNSPFTFVYGSLISLNAFSVVSV